MLCSILGKTREAREEAPEVAEVVCSARIVVLWAMQELREVSCRAAKGRGGSGILEERRWRRR